MALESELSGWLTLEGDHVVQKIATNIPLNNLEHAIYEIWLLDTQFRNGGVSQYFCNCRLSGWKKCKRSASEAGIDSFPPLAKGIDSLIGKSKNPYSVLLKKSELAELVYSDNIGKIVHELRAKLAAPKRKFD